MSPLRASDRPGSATGPSGGGRRPPGPPPSAVDFAAYRRNKLRFLQRVASFGDVARFNLGREEMYLVVHPDHVKDVLVTSSSRFATAKAASFLFGNGLPTSEGEFHRRQRRLMNPAFHHSRIAGYAEVMAAYADQAQARWRDGQEVDIHREMEELTLAIVGKTLFDTDIGGPDSARFSGWLARLRELNDWQSSGDGDDARGRGSRQTLRAQTIAEVDGFLYDVIESRRRDAEDRRDILSMLLLAQDEEGDGGGMTDKQLRDESITLVVAGHETVANALTWTWFLLGQNPDVEAKLHAELDDVLDGRRPTGEDVGSLQYTRMVFAEALRLYPPVPTSGRRVIEEHELGGYRIPVGATVMLSQYLVHRDPRWWPDPDRFDPERWTPEARAQRPKFAYFPFGGGSRLCIGEQFAWMEGVLAVASIGRRTRLRPVANHSVALKPGFTLQPAEPLAMRVRSRS